MASMDRGVHSQGMSTVTLMRSPAADRNKDAILQVLRRLVLEDGIMALEIGSGTGQHVTYFAEHLSNVTWMPSECDKKSIQSISAYIQIIDRKNVQSPIWIDTTSPVNEWANGVMSPGSCDLMLSINMVHIAEWAAAEGLFRGGGHFLKSGGKLVTYGPYKLHGEITPESNVEFDKMLRQQNVSWGLRDIDDLEKLAQANGLVFEQTIDMPANNKILVYKKA